MDLIEHKNYTRSEWSQHPFFDYLKNKEIKVAVDAGGCAGEFSHILLSKIPTLEKCVIIEPIEESFLFIKERFLEDQRVEVLHAALYQTEKELKIGKHPINSGGHGIFMNVEDFETIKTVSLEEVSSNIDYLKMDIEGAEYNILEHSSSILHIPYITIEMHSRPMVSFDPALDDKFPLKHPFTFKDAVAYLREKLYNHAVLTFDQYQNVFLIRKDLVENEKDLGLICP